MAQYTNPNQQGGGENKSFMVMMLALLGVLLGMQFITAKKKAAEPKQPAAISQSANAPATPNPT